eukprot:1084305-Rhodomonas_salina.6
MKLLVFVLLRLQPRRRQRVSGRNRIQATPFSAQFAPILPLSALDSHCDAAVSYTHLTLPTICSV